MKRKLATTLLLVAAVVMSTLASFSVGPKARAAPPDDPDTPPTFWPINGYPPTINDNVILKWDEELLQAVRANPAATGPTVTARALGVLHTATYDAWAAYDPIAKVTRPDGPSQQPKNEITLDNKKKAISYAAYQVLMDLFPNSPADFPAQMAELNYPVDGSDTSTASAVGTQAAQAVLAFRHNDGSNQTLDTKGTADPKDDTVIYPYPACTPTVTTNCYSPKNDWNKLNDPWSWQPLCVLTAAGLAAGYPPIRDPSASTCPDGTATTPSHYTLQRALTPQWGKIASFASLSAIQYKIPGPPKNPDGTCCSSTDIDTALADTSNLDDVKKAKAEYWADGPQTEFPPGHAAVFAQALSRKRGHSLDTDVKLFFALGNALLDASIASWREKYKWDFVRPVTAIRNHYTDDINSWLGPGHSPSFGLVPPAQWMPYQALTVVTPPFPEYVSGHSTFSGACSQILLGFTGSDGFNASVTISAGSLKIEPGVPSQDVTLSWPTFTAAADEAGWSRRYGGIHFYSGDIHGRMLGKSVGSNAWSKAQAYIKGYAGYSPTS
jgi:PAP2 superfamily